MDEDMKMWKYLCIKMSWFFVLALLFGVVTSTPIVPPPAVPTWPIFAFNFSNTTSFTVVAVREYYVVGARIIGIQFVSCVSTIASFSVLLSFVVFRNDYNKTIYHQFIFFKFISDFFSSLGSSNDRSCTNIMQIIVRSRYPSRQRVLMLVSRNFDKHLPYFIGQVLLFNARVIF